MISPTKRINASHYPKERVDVVKKLYIGKHVLLTAKFVDGKHFPAEEKKYLFQYIKAGVNQDCKSPTLDYEFEFIKEGGTQFKNYPEQTSQDQCLENYSVELLKEVCELNCKYLTVMNRDKNDKCNEDILKA